MNTLVKESIKVTIAAILFTTLGYNTGVSTISTKVSAFLQTYGKQLPLDNRWAYELSIYLGCLKGAALQTGMLETDVKGNVVQDCTNYAHTAIIGEK